MTRKLRRGKSKVYTSISQVLPKHRGKGRHPGHFQEVAHTEHHMPRIMVYTSATTISATAGCPIFPPRGGRIVATHLNVKGAPSGANLTCDVFIAGATIYDSDKPFILDGELTSGVDANSDLQDEPDHPDPNLAAFAAFEKIEIVPVNVSGATGPLIVQLEIDWED